MTEVMLSTGTVGISLNLNQFCRGGIMNRAMATALMVAVMSVATAGVANAWPKEASDGCLYLRAERGQNGWSAQAGLPVQCGGGVDGHVDISGPEMESLANAWSHGPVATAFGRGSGQVCATLWNHAENAPQQDWVNRGTACVDI
ncbi:hypothetical protein ACWFRF_32615 [Nocardia sp. NPDC055165]